jgi:hypothetical protein
MAAASAGTPTIQIKPLHLITTPLLSAYTEVKNMIVDANPQLML